MKNTQQSLIKRKIQLAVISDVHLGTHGCRAKELLRYLHSIEPEYLILNGDIIDIWQFRKNYFPQEHLEVLKKIIEFSENNTQVIYLTGNHDEMLRKFSDVSIGRIKIVDKHLMWLNGKKAWFFHGDVFDASIQNAKWLAKIGGWSYDMLIRLNRIINWWLIHLGKERYSLSKKIKNSVKKAVKYINNFENVAANLAIKNDYDYVICGHIHQPVIESKQNGKGCCMYLNSGDWIENLSALEYYDHQWHLIYYEDLNLEENLKKPVDPSKSTISGVMEFINSNTRFFS